MSSSGIISRQLPIRCTHIHFKSEMSGTCPLPSQAPYGRQSLPLERGVSPWPPQATATGWIVKAAKPHRRELRILTTRDNQSV